MVHLTGPPDALLLLQHGPGLVTNLRNEIDRVNADRLGQFTGLTRRNCWRPTTAPTRIEAPYAQVLTDKVIHHQDIRRPLGHPRAIPPERVEVSLRRVIASRWVFGGRARAKGLRIEANDIDFAHGNGPLVRGTGEALLLALSGRPAAVDDLDGDGQATLAARVRGNASL